MKNELKESLSAFMDGEATAQQALFEQFKVNAAMRHTWARYHLIRDVMKHRHVSQATVLSQRVAQALQDEPILFAPQHKRRITRHTGQLIGWSVAASLMLVTAIWFSQRTLSVDEEAVGLTAFNQEGQATAEVEQTLSDYIVSHNEYSASAKMQGMLPYTRLISYSSTQQQAGNRIE